MEEVAGTARLVGPAAGSEISHTAAPLFPPTRSPRGGRPRSQMPAVISCVEVTRLRVTKAPQCAPYSTKSAIAFNCFHRILRAGWRKSAGRSQPGRDRELVASQQGEHEENRGNAAEHTPSLLLGDAVNADDRDNDEIEAVGAHQDAQVRHDVRHRLDRRDHRRISDDPEARLERRFSRWKPEH